MKKIFFLLLLLQIFPGIVMAQQKSFPSFSSLPEQKKLPDPLMTMDGKPVKTAEQWRKERRPELKVLFQHYMYGYLPPAPKIHAGVGKTYKDFLGGKATMREITIELGKTGAPKINLMVITPNKIRGSVPVILGINFCGNHTVVKDPRVTLNPNWLPASQFCPGVVNNRATEAARGAGIDSDWDVEGAIDRGYAVASFYHGDLAPDTPDFTKGVFPYFSAPQATKDDAWGAVAAWAWGFHRAIDYLVTDKNINKNRIAIFGHSRNGKAAMFAAAMDERVAMVFPHQAGMGGTSPSRGTTGEPIKAINDRFPHWFNDIYPQFNNDPARLPFDQNCLVALMAPRPAMFSCAVEDTWSNPAGQLEVLQSASKVYEFLGVEGLKASQLPEPGKMIDSNLGFFYRPGKHSTLKEDWKAFLDFADKHLK